MTCNPIAAFIGTDEEGFVIAHMTGYEQPPAEGLTANQALDAVRQEGDVYSATELARQRAELEESGFVSRQPFRQFADFTGADRRFRDEAPVKLSRVTPSYDEQRAEQEAAGVAMRFNAGKLRYDLLPTDAIEELVAIYTMGAAKYADRNWERGFDWMSCYASLQRHAALWAKGEDRDEESQRLHMGHVAWNALALVAFALRGVGTDDRPTLRAA